MSKALLMIGAGPHSPLRPLEDSDTSGLASMTTEQIATENWLLRPQTKWTRPHTKSLAFSSAASESFCLHQEQLLADQGCIQVSQSVPILSGTIATICCASLGGNSKLPL